MPVNSIEPQQQAVLGQQRGDDTRCLLTAKSACSYKVEMQLYLCRSTTSGAGGFVPKAPPRLGLIEEAFLLGVASVLALPDFTGDLLPNKDSSTWLSFPTVRYLQETCNIRESLCGSGVSLRVAPTLNVWRRHSPGCQGNLAGSLAC